MMLRELGLQDWVFKTKEQLLALLGDFINSRSRQHEARDRLRIALRERESLGATELWRKDQIEYVFEIDS